MNSRPELKLDWCSHAAAKYAVEHWHYSKCLPSGKVVKVGVWESGTFIGAVLFSRGANNHLGSPYKLNQLEICELTRIALTKHQTPVTRIVAVAFRFLKQSSPGLRMIVSYADPLQGHHGGIYQGGGWIYDGKQQDQTEYIVNGEQIHGRSCMAKFGTIRGLKKITVTGKHKYLMPLDAEMRKRILPLAKPYPKRAGSDTTDTPANHAGKGGSIPTPALQSSPL